MSEITPPSAYQEGIDANSHARLRSECPYGEGSLERQQWLDGWDEAEQTAKSVGGTF